MEKTNNVFVLIFNNKLSEFSVVFLTFSQSTIANGFWEKVRKCTWWFIAQHCHQLVNLNFFFRSMNKKALKQWKTKRSFVAWQTDKLYNSLTLQEQILCNTYSFPCTYVVDVGSYIFMKLWYVIPKDWKKNNHDKIRIVLFS